MTPKTYKITSDNSEYYFWDETKLIAVFLNRAQLTLFLSNLDFGNNSTISELRKFAEKFGSILIENPIPY